MTPISPRTRGPASSTKPLQRSSISSYRARKPGQLQRVALIETQQRSADRRCPTSAYAPRPSVGDPPTRTTSGSARSRTVQLGLPARSLSSFGRAGPRYRIGDISITPMVASCDGPRDCFPVGEAAERACAMPRQQPSRPARRTTGSPRPSGSHAARGRRHPPHFRFRGIGRSLGPGSDRPSSAVRVIAMRKEQ